MHAFGWKSWPARSFAALVVCALAMTGCRSFQPLRIDPSGQRIFLPAESTVAPGAYVMPDLPNVAIPQPRVTLAPREIIAPVGSEVVLQAGVDGEAPTLFSGQRIEWMLSAESAGSFVSLGRSGGGCLTRWSHDRPRKVTNKYAIGATSLSPINITRGTPGPEDDLTIGSGRSWISVTSVNEGTSLVTAFAPGVASWNLRRSSATIHWVDAQWVFPPPSINPVGSQHVFTTAITRTSDGSPIEQWHVRYEILGGPPAGFAPDGIQVLIVPTDPLGQASVEIMQTEPQAGTSRIGIQIIRPAVPGTSQTKRLVLGSGITTKTWTSPDLAVRTLGPAQASVGSKIVYSIEVTNPGDLPTRDVTLHGEVPQGTSYTASNPEATPQGRRIEWKLGELAPRATRTFQAEFRADSAGSANFCAEVRSAEGLSARDCAATTVSVPRLEVTVEGPETAAVGETVRYYILVTNRSAIPATGLTIRDEFDDGFKHIVSESPIERSLQDMAPGEERPIYITLRVVKPGRLCHRVEVAGDEGFRAAANACLQAERIEVQPQPEAEAPIRTTPEPQLSTPAGRPALEVKKTGPRELRVGQTAEFFITIKNTGEVPLTNLRISDGYELSLDPVNATDGFTVGREELVWTLSRLEVGKTHQLQVNCRCVSPTDRACNRVTVTCEERPPLVDESCVKILPNEETMAPSVESPGEARLTLSITGLDQPVALGGTARYRVFVQNEGTAPANSTRLVVILPPELSVVREGTRPRVRATFQQQRIVFEPVAELRPGEPMTFEIQAQANQPGKVSILAELTSDELKEPLKKSEQTEILERK